jgi:beta-lactamase regulating signal transducer with metallopeptidase domain
MTELLLASPVIQLFNFVLGTSWAACLIVPEILILQRLFKAKFSARWHCFLWFILIAQLAVPWLPQFPLSVTSKIPSPGIDVDAFTGGAVSVGEAVAPSEAVTSVHALSSVTNDAAISTLNIVIAIWFLVACLILLHIAYLAIRTRRRLQTAQAVTDPP